MPITLFMINIVASSVVFGWLSEHTQRSVLPVMVMHTSLNAWAGMLIFPLAATGATYAFVTALLVVIALVLLIRGGPRLQRSDSFMTIIPTGLLTV